jgi:hypothetical protein
MHWSIAWKSNVQDPVDTCNVAQRPVGDVSKALEAVAKFGVVSEAETFPFYEIT